ncbi:MAG: SusD/RagB family nutrient-binding outer membrane lipoprotein [Bacteroidota bacterium]
MKRHTIIKFIGIFVLISLMTSSCKKWIDPDINVSPNSPSDVTVNLLLPSAQAGIAYAVGGDLGYASLIWMQQYAGGGNQPLGYDRYSLTQSDVDNVWKYAMYAAPMMDLYQIMNKAATEGSPYYAGIAKILMAYSLGDMTDLFGAIPYSEAFLGTNSAHFDSQQAIYTTIDGLLTGAITDLAATSSVRTPGSDDLIFGGDLAKWTATAWAFKARYAIHLSKKNGATSAYANALTALQNAIASNAGDCQFSFGTASNENNPVYQFVQQRPYDIVMGKFFVDTLNNTNDPRLPFFADTTGGGAVGSAPGQANANATLQGPYYASATSPVVFISYVEMKFIEAEAKYPTDKAAAAAAFNAAVKASVLKVTGASAPAWEALHASETAGSITLDKIIMQKYIALFLQIEVYNDWRRTGIPSLVPASNGFITSIPRRYPYPTSERLYNANCPSAVITDRVWWDVP